jgi:predicted O-methyltransferase YrrM
VRVSVHLALWAVGLEKAETQTTVLERDCLARHALGKRCIVEIGVWHGVTTSRLRASMAPDGVLYAVDPFQPGRMGFSAQRLIARREVAKVSNGRVEWIRMTGAEAGHAHLEAGRPRPELVFIDGSHDLATVRSDWEAWSSLVTPGGVIALHDSRSTASRCIEGTGSVILTNEVVLRDERFRRVESIDSLTVVRRQ